MSGFNKYIIGLSGILFLFAFLGGQKENASSPSKEQSSRGNYRIMFYNVENLFDTFDDSLRNDEDFLPTSALKWNNYKYNEKLKHIFQSIAAVGGTESPEVIGFAEIENRKVLNELLKFTPLEKFNYRIIHQESPDARGIDVALIYRADRVKPLKCEFIRARYPWKKTATTRDILYLKALLGTDTLHIFVNHWPSRRGGQKESEANRCFVAQLLKAKLDSLFLAQPNSKTLIMGDFNDEPEDLSLSKYLGAQIPGEILEEFQQYNLMWSLKKKCKCGSYRYKAQWNMLDQFIVSGSLLKNKPAGLTTCAECVHIGDFDFLQLEDTKYGGTKPYRSYKGTNYEAGYSDHLPIYIDLFVHP